MWNFSRSRRPFPVTGNFLDKDRESRLQPKIRYDVSSSIKYAAGPHRRENESPPFALIGRSVLEPDPASPAAFARFFPSGEELRPAAAGCMARRN